MGRIMRGWREIKQMSKTHSEQMALTDEERRHYFAVTSRLRCLVAYKDWKWLRRNYEEYYKEK